MKLSYLKQASDYEVEKWLEESLDLTQYQKEKLFNNEIVRFAPFYFYKVIEKQTNFWWRLTILIYPIYWILLFSYLPINWIFTGKWGYARKFIDNFHSKWTNKLGL